MTKRFFYYLLCLFLILLNGCNDDYEPQNELNGNKPIVLAGEIEQVTVTRVNDSGFCTGDAIGIYIVDYQGSNPGKLALTNNRANNVKFTFDEESNRWNSSYDLYWKDDITHIDAYGYYPYGNPLAVEEYSFVVQKDQARPAADGVLSGYEASDFLWAKATDVAPTTSIIQLSFKHKMSNARVMLQEGSGFADREWAELNKQIMVTNTRQSALVNLNEGTVKPVGEVSITGIIPARQDQGEFRAVVVPQTIDAFLPLFSITVGSQSYKFIKQETFTYISGKMHNFSIVINKRAETGDYEFELANESITAWENDLMSHDATAREYIVVHVPEAGRLKEAMLSSGKDYRKLRNLKLTGEINSDDFSVMREEMESLQSLNLKEVIIKASQYLGEGNGKENWIPFQAMCGKSTLQRIVLPDKLEGIEFNAFGSCESLTGSLYIPEGVIAIDDNAFYLCKNITGILSLPTTLKKIGNYAFHLCKFSSELVFPSGLNYIGDYAFTQCSNLYGSLNFPDGLTYIGVRAFSSCVNLTGSISIPQGVTEIGEGTFHGSWGINGTLTLHDGITAIYESAFQETRLRGELILPKNLAIISGSAFSGCDFSGELKLPDNLVVIGEWSFVNNYRLNGVLIIPETVHSIGANSFMGCGIEKIILPANLESVLSNAFGSCFNLSSITCKAHIPPYVQADAFNGVPKDNFTLEVPESSVHQYRVAPGWSEFKRISAHRELLCRPYAAKALNTQCTRQLILDAESDWEVESMPDWCVLSATNGSQKTELILTINRMSRGNLSRTGDIVFKLRDKDYTTRCTVTQYDYEYDEDQIVTLQQATRGEGVNLVFLGDGFTAGEISNGDYMKTIRRQMEYFFGIEPYKTYRDYFNVYTGIAVSAESGIETVNTVRNNRFGSSYTAGTAWSCDEAGVFNYALQMPGITYSNLNKSLIIMTPNTTEYDGTCLMWEDGSAIAFCPVSTYGYPFDTRGIVQHEAGGHGFGKLGDENIFYNAFIGYPGDAELHHYQSLGWFQNLSLTGKMHEVPWSHLIFNERYSEIVDIYEGGYMHSRGVFRSELNSCMNNNIPYYSTISREAIVKRIMDYAGEEYTFEKFLANDKPDTGATTRSAGRYGGQNPYGRQSAPEIHKGKPGIVR